MPWKDIDYTYDDVGNRLTKTEGCATDDYNYYPGTNKLNEVVTDTDTVTYTYDLNGNITGIGDMVLTYNQNNRLAMVEEDSVVLGEYTYNGLGQRIKKEVDGITTIFHYDFDGNIIAESDENGYFDKEYLYRSSSRLALVDAQTGELYYYGNDRLGTPQILTDSTNMVVWEAVYEPFGDADINPNSSVVSNFRFPGQYYDSETGLHYNYHRYYDPGTGRYMTPDPSHFYQAEGTGIPYLFPILLASPQELNLYHYTINNPVNFTDPFGLISCDGTWQKKGWDRVFNITCICYWLCIPCDKPVIWSGNPRNLPWTWGIMVHTGYGGGLESGDDCFCNKPGPDKDCTKCE